MKKYVLNLRERGGAVNSAIMLAGVSGIVKCLERMRLREYVEGMLICWGHVELTTSWVKSLLKQMNFTKCKATTKLGMSTKAFEEVKKNFLQSD